MIEKTIEGVSSDVLSKWVVDVVVHVFNKEKRIFYGLEELWGDAKITQINPN